MREFINNEPVIVRTVLAVMAAVVLSLIPETYDNLENALQMLAILGIGSSARRKVTPVSRLRPAAAEENMDI